MGFLYLLENIRNPVFTILFQGVTALGESVVLILLAALIYWLYDEKLGYRIGLATLSGALLVNVLKVIVAMPRPWQLDPNFTAIASVLETATGYSFPSGHTQAAASAYYCLFMHFRKNRRRGWFLAAILLVAFSRMYLGVHTPLDVLVGFVIGFASAIWAMSRKFPLYGPRQLVLMALCALSFVFGFFMGYIREAEMLSDVFQSAGALFGFALGIELDRRGRQFMASRASGIGEALLTALVGLLGMFGVYFGLRALFGQLFGQAPLLVGIRYACVTCYVVWLYPLLLSLYRERRIRQPGNR